MYQKLCQHCESKRNLNMVPSFEELMVQLEKIVSAIRVLCCPSSHAGCHGDTGGQDQPFSPSADFPTVLIRQDQCLYSVQSSRHLPSEANFSVSFDLSLLFLHYILSMLFSFFCSFSKQSLNLKNPFQVTSETQS